MLGRFLAAALAAGIAVGAGCGLPGAVGSSSGFSGSGGMTSSATSSHGASGGSGGGISIGSTGAAGGTSDMSASSAGGSSGTSTSNASSGSGTGGATACYDDPSVVCCPENGSDMTGGCTPANCVYDGSGQFCCKDGGTCSLTPSHNFKCDDTSMCSSQAKLCCAPYMFDMGTMMVKYTGDASCQNDCGNPMSGAELCNTNNPHCSSGQCCASQALGHGLGHCASMCF